MADSLHTLLRCVFGTVMLSTAQEQKTEIKHATASPTSAASGKEMFKAYCASCHGEDAKGDGPAAAALKQPPADLTALAKATGASPGDEGDQRPDAAKRPRRAWLPGDAGVGCGILENERWARS